MQAIYSAAYVFTDRAYVKLDGDPELEVIVSICPKDLSVDAAVLSKEFDNELLSFAEYYERLGNTKNIREFVLQRGLFSNDPEKIKEGYELEFESSENLGEDK